MRCLLLAFTCASWGEFFFETFSEVNPLERERAWAKSSKRISKVSTLVQYKKKGRTPTNERTNEPRTKFHLIERISAAWERFDGPVLSRSAYLAMVMSTNDVDGSLFSFSFFSFFFTRKVLCSFAYQHGTNWKTSRITSEEICLLLLISEPCTSHSAPRLVRNKEASWSLHETSLMCLAPVMTRDSSFLMVWFDRQIHHGSFFLRPCLRLCTPMHHRRHRGTAAFD